MEIVEDDHALGASSKHHDFTQIFVLVAIMLLSARLSSVVKKIGLPSVIGELGVGIGIGWLALHGISFLGPIITNEIIAFLAELGIVLLLFMIGLESNIGEMKKLGIRVALVAITSIVVTFLLAYTFGPLLIPNLSQGAYILLAAALTPTSIGISVRVFQDLGKIKSKEAKMVVGAAVIDDVLALLILTIVSGFISAGSINFVDTGVLVVKAVGFLVGSIVLGQFIAPYVGKLFSSISNNLGMKIAMALSFCLTFAYLARLLGLEPIIGAFAAGLVLDPVHFDQFEESSILRDIRSVLDTESTLKKGSKAVREKFTQLVDTHHHKSVEDILEPIGLLLIPLFFVKVGTNVDLSTFSNPRTILVALGLVLIAVAGKFVSGFVAGKDVNYKVVGLGMAVRGEVVLIFASIGQGLGVITPELFSALVLMILIIMIGVPAFLARELQKA